MNLDKLIRNRKLYFSERIHKLKGAKGGMDVPYDAMQDKKEVTTVLEANLIGSRTDTVGHMHMPVLDIDFEADLVPSKTPGHYHLYLHKEVPWSRYEQVLLALSEAGIIERGYAGASIEAKCSFVRIPSGQEIFESIEEGGMDNDGSA